MCGQIEWWLNNLTQHKVLGMAWFNDESKYENYPKVNRRMECRLCAETSDAFMMINPKLTRLCLSGETNSFLPWGFKVSVKGFIWLLGMVVTLDQGNVPGEKGSDKIFTLSHMCNLTQEFLAEYLYTHVTMYMDSPSLHVLNSFYYEV